MSRQAIPFKGTVPAAGELTKRYFLRKDGTIEKLYNRIYSGPVGNLKIYPKLIKQGEIYMNVLTPADPQVDYINGDDDRDEFDLTVPFDRGDVLEVRAVNTGSYDYDLNLTMTVDYYGGKRRVI